MFELGAPASLHQGEVFCFSISTPTLLLSWLHILCCLVGILVAPDFLGNFLSQGTQRFSPEAPRDYCFIVPTRHPHAPYKQGTRPYNMFLKQQKKCDPAARLPVWMCSRNLASILECVRTPGSACHTKRKGACVFAIYILFSL